MKKSQALILAGHESDSPRRVPRSELSDIKVLSSQ